MHLQFDGHGPLHAQLTRALKAAMIAGWVGAGARLPATRLLARELGMSRNTVLAAYEQLRAEGFIDGRMGSGSYATSLQGASKRLPAMPLAQVVTAPQSAYARRLRSYHDRSRVPGQAIPGMRHAFQYGVPLTNPALTTSWARALSQSALYTKPNYPMAQGLPALREAVCDYLARRRGIQAAPEDVLIVAGTQQALALTARVLLDAGDEAAIEEPHYHAIRVTLQVHGARLRLLPVDEQGLQCDALPLPAPRLLCVTPSHQFPTGAVLPLPRRMALLDYAQRHGSWIFEDDYDGEFRYDSKPLAALRSLDEHGRVIYVGTFSKAMFPALRMGYLLMPPGLRGDFIAARWLEDLGSPAIEQAALAGFIADGSFERHLRRAAKTLKERRAALLAGLRACSRGRLEIADSQAGMHLVVWLRDRGRQDGEALVARARARPRAVSDHALLPRPAGPRRPADGLRRAVGAGDSGGVEGVRALPGRPVSGCFNAKQWRRPPAWTTWRGDAGQPGEGSIRTSLKDLPAQLDAAHFVPVHRSVVVNLRALSRVTRGHDETASITWRAASRCCR